MSVLIKYENNKFHVLTGYQKEASKLTGTWEEIAIKNYLDLGEEDIDPDDLAQVLECSSYAILEVE